MLKRGKFKDIEIPQGYQEMMDNLSYWLAAFAAERYSYISRGKTVTALSIFTKLLEHPQTLIINLVAKAVPNFCWSISRAVQFT